MPLLSRCPVTPEKDGTRWKKWLLIPQREGLTLSPLSLNSRLPLAQRTWKVPSPSWSFLVAVTLQAVEQKGTYFFCNRQPRYSHLLIIILQLSQTHPCLRYGLSCWVPSPMNPVFSDQSHFPISHFFQVGVCNLLISQTPLNGVRQAALFISSFQAFHPSVTGTEHQIATMRN